MTRIAFGHGGCFVVGAINRVSTAYTKWLVHRAIAAMTPDPIKPGAGFVQAVGCTLIPVAPGASFALVCNDFRHQVLS